MKIHDNYWFINYPKPVPIIAARRASSAPLFRGLTPSASLLSPLFAHPGVHTPIFLT